MSLCVHLLCATSVLEERSPLLYQFPHGIMHNLRAQSGQENRLAAMTSRALIQKVLLMAQAAASQTYKIDKMTDKIF